MKKTIEFKKCGVDAPKKDGRYVVIDARDNDTRVLGYTVKGGWNTSYRSDGSLSDEWVIEFTPEQEHYWTEIKIGKNK